MARPRLGESESVRLQLVITSDEVAAIDNWQHDNHVASRSEAIRRLVQLGLRTMENVDALSDAVFATSEACDALDQEFSTMLEDEDAIKDAGIFARQLALHFFEKFPNLAERAESAHNRMVDLGLELNAVSAADTVPLAIEAGNLVRRQMEEQRQRWAKEDALRHQLESELYLGKEGKPK